MSTTTTDFSFIVNRKAFTEALGTLAPSICTRATLPILHNVLIEVTDVITVSATNLEIGTRQQVPSDACTIVETGSLTVNYKELVALLKPMKDEEVYFTQRNNALQIEGANVNVTLSGKDSSEYPLIPVHEYIEGKTQQIALPIETLRQMITLTTFAAADDDSRPVLTGVNARLKGNKFTFAAADAFRLAIDTEEIPESGTWDFDVLIPATTLEAVKKQLPKAKKNVDPGNITITISENKAQAMFSREGYTLVTRLIDGTYPAYERIVPSEFDCLSECEVSALKAALDTVKPIAQNASNITRFTVNGHIDVFAQCENDDWKQGDPEEDKTKHSQASVPAQTTNAEGEEYKILLNNKYVCDILAAHPTGTVQMGIHKPTQHVLSWNATRTQKEEVSTKPAKITFPDIPGYTAVIMPMHIQR